MNQNITGVNAIAVARSGTNPSNTEVLWLDTSTSDNIYERLKAFDGVNWSLINRTPIQVLEDLKTVDGAGSGLDADTLQGYTPSQLMSSGGGGGSTPPLATGQMLVGQGDSIGTAQSIGGIATVNTSGTLLYVPNSISHTGLNDIGVNTHVQIDSHISSTSNPHNVSASQVGNSTAQWNANSIDGNDSTIGVLGAGQDGMALTWDNGTSKFILAAGGGDNMSNADLTFNGSYSADLNGNTWTVKNGLDDLFEIKSDGQIKIGLLSNSQNTTNPYEDVLFGWQSQILGSTSQKCTVVGTKAVARGLQSTSIGYLADCTSTNGVAVGRQSKAGGSAVSVGPNATATGDFDVAIGPNSIASGSFGTALGMNTTVTSISGVAVGYLANANGVYSISVGNSSITNATDSIAIGRILTNNHSNSIILGSQYTSLATKQFAVAFAGVELLDFRESGTGTSKLYSDFLVKGSDTSSLTTGLQYTASDGSKIITGANGGRVNFGNYTSELSGSTVSHHFIGVNGRTTAASVAFNNFIFENNAQGGITSLVGDSHSSQLIQQSANGRYSLIRTDFSKSQIDYYSSMGSSYWLTRLTGGGGCTVLGSSTNVRTTADIDTGVQVMVQVGSLQMFTNSETVNGNVNNCPDFMLRTAYRTVGGVSFENNMRIGSVTDNTGNYQLDIKNESNTVLASFKHTGVFNISNIPTSSVGLVAGDIWSNSGVLTIV